MSSAIPPAERARIASLPAGGVIDEEIERVLLGLEPLRGFGPAPASLDTEEAHKVLRVLRERFHDVSVCWWRKERPGLCVVYWGDSFTKEHPWLEEVSAPTFPLAVSRAALIAFWTPPEEVKQ